MSSHNQTDIGCHYAGGTAGIRLAFHGARLQQCSSVSKTLAKAADLAQKIFRNAGLDMVWIEFVPEQPIGREEIGPGRLRCTNSCEG